MSVDPDHTVGLRELRHNIGEVMARIRGGEAIDITEYGRPIARIVPVQPRTEAPHLAHLVETGRAKRAVRPGYRPPLRARGTSANALGNALDELRAEDRW